MPLSTFPALRGLSWSTFKEPQFSTIVQKAVSGRETRVSRQPFPTWLFKLKFDYLSQVDYQILLGFYLQQQGSLGQFQFVDPTDNSVIDGYIGTGDGVRTVYPFTRAMGAFYEPVQFIYSIAAVRFNGVPFGTPGNEWGAATTTPGTLGFIGAPPAPGVVITSDFTFGFLCRFADDTYSFENFMHQLWTLKEIKLQSVLA